MPLPLNDPLGSNKSTYKMDLSRRDLGIILAALQYWQRTLPLVPNTLPEWNIATGLGDFRGMDHDEIEWLCSRLQLGNKVHI